MTERQLRIAITEPAKKAGSPVDDDLVRFCSSKHAPVFTRLTAISDEGLDTADSAKLLATGGNDGTVRLWNLSLFLHPYAALCDDVGPPMRQDWAKYAPGESQPKICA